MFNWFFRVIKGIIIALGFILPGVSGGVLAAILGIYERMLSFLAHIRRDFKGNFLYFLPVGIGGVLGLVLLSKPLDYLLAHFQVIVLWGFAGAILGSLPALFRESTEKTNRDRIDVYWLIGTFLVSLVVLYMLPAIGLSVPANFGGFVLAGVLIALGVLVPGLSPSNLLIILGLFTPMLTGFQNRDLLGVFLPIAIGGVIALLAFSKLMERLLTSYHSRVYHFIIGLVLSSTILILVPSKSAESISYAGLNAMSIILSLVFFVLGLVLGLWMARLEAKYK
jgi:putative membrane protein